MVRKFEDARADHRKRYEFAAERLKGLRVLDIACGCGYGSWFLHQAGNEVTGVDIEPEAIAWAKEHFSGEKEDSPGPTFIQADAQKFHSRIYDALVTFETLEHLDYPQVLLDNWVSKVIASVPNQEGYPFKAHRFEGDKYPHKRHYKPQEFEELLTKAGFKVKEKFCQKDKLGEISEGTEGMFLIYVATKGA